MDAKRYLIQKTPIGTMMKENLEGNWVETSDFDRVTAERDALQLRLNAVEEENDRLRLALNSKDPGDDLGREKAEIARLPVPKEQPFCGICNDAGCSDCY